MVCKIGMEYILFAYKFDYHRSNLNSNQCSQTFKKNITNIKVSNLPRGWITLPNDDKVGDKIHCRNGISSLG